MKVIVRKAQRKASAASPTALLTLIQATLDGDKAENVAVIDMAGKSAIADFMVIATGRSNRQVASMAEHLREKVKAASGRSPPIEGLVHGDWVLVDAGDVVVHLFRPEVRAFYNLEKMWSEALPEQGDGMAGLIKERPDKMKPGKAKHANPKPAGKAGAGKKAPPGAKAAPRRKPSRPVTARRRSAG